MLDDKKKYTELLETSFRRILKVDVIYNAMGTSSYQLTYDKKTF